MITIILVVLFDIFTTINTYSPPCGNSSCCQCSLNSLDDMKMDYDDNLNIEIIANISSWNGLEIICKGTQNLDDFNYSSKRYGKTIDSLLIRSCVLSNTTSLDKFVKKLGIVESHTFSFQSFKTNNTLLTREHLKGISNVKELILSYNNLSNISIDFFVDFSELEKLDLSHNNLTQLNDIFNATPHLKYLDLNKNNIYSMSPTLFYKLEELEHLDLGYNRLRNIHGSTFNKQESLKSLSLKANGMTDVSLELFSELKNLKTIDISYNNFVSIPQDLFLKNKHLRRILFHNNTIDLKTVPDYIFANLEKLEEVNLNKVGILYLPDSLFYYSPSLKYFYFENNLLISLRHTYFRALKNLEVLKLNNNLIREIPERIFTDLGKLKILDLSMNNIYNITSDAFEGLISLTELNMENNFLKYISQVTLSPLTNLSIAKFSNNQLVFGKESKVWSPFYHNHYLKELHLSYNSIEDFFNDWSMSYTLILLNLTHNNIDTISAGNFHFQSKKILVDLSYNKIKNIFMDDIKATAIDQTEKRDVVVLLDYNPILCDCYLYDLIRYFHNEMPTFVYNYIEIVGENLSCIYTDGTMGPKMKELNSTIYFCPENKYFNIDTNCPFNCTCSVRLKDKTRILDCSNKNIFNFVIDEKSVYFVNNFPVILNLTGNALTKLPSIKPLKPIKITTLLLSNNRISEITIDELPKDLEVLELHNNYISSIDSNVMKRLLPGFLYSLTLSGNPIVCDCGAVDLLQYVVVYRSFYEDLNKLKCEHMDFPMYFMSSESFCPPVSGLEEKIRIAGR